MDTRSSPDDRRGTDPDAHGASTSSRRRGRGERRQVPLWVLVACVVVVGLLAPTITAQAGLGPSFSDVPGSHPFFDEIDWMARTGITEGYDDGTFRPDARVSRQEMSAFMQRLFNLQDDMGWAVRDAGVSTSSTTFTDVPAALTSVTVPDGATASLAARFSAESQVVGTPGSWASVRLMVSRNGGDFQEMLPVVGTNAGFDSVDGGDAWESHAIERVMSVQSGTYSVKAQYCISSGVVALDDYVLVVDADLKPAVSLG